MIGIFESTVRRYPERVCFTFVDELGYEESWTYKQTRLVAATMARRLQELGVQRGDYVSVDLPNCPVFAFLLLAAAYGSFTLMPINHRLTVSEKHTRLLELERQPGMHIAYRVDQQNEKSLMRFVKDTLAGKHTSKDSSARSFWSQNIFPPPRTSSQSQEGHHKRVIMGAQQDAQEEAIHFAERQAHLFDVDARALVMFTSGTTGKPKAVPLTWRHLTGAADSSNEALNEYGTGLWQAALPLFHIGGLQVMVRSILNRCPFILYARFDAARILEDAPRYKVTHVSVVDKMLQDLLTVDEQGLIQSYQCILLGGGAFNHKSIEAALSAGARVHASYGMTETSSQIAQEQITNHFDGGMRLLPGYTARIVDPHEDGFGRLAVKGPGVFEEYVNARAAFTVDGYFLTGDTAALCEGRLYVKERTTDMFVSGGENVYPAEIVDKLIRVPGVADAYVLGVADATWGRRPVAFVEYNLQAQMGIRAESSMLDTTPWSAADGFSSSASGAAQAVTSNDSVTAFGSGTTSGSGTASGFDLASVSRFYDVGAEHAVPANDPPTDTFSPSVFASAVRTQLKQDLSKLNLPKHVFAVKELPRTGIGKVDRATLGRWYDERIEVKRVTLYHVRVPFKAPFKTAKATLRYRESIIVEVTDYAGRTGLGECVAFDTDWYLPETLEQDAAVLQHLLAPKILAETYLHPREVSASLKVLSDAVAFPLARGAIEPALWDLYGKIVGKPLWQLLLEEAAHTKLPSRISPDSKGFSVPSAARASLGSNSRLNQGTQSFSEGHSAARSTASVVVPAGAVIGLGTPAETVEAARRCVAAGYRRVKLKVAPGNSALRVRAVREVFPQLMITLDANQSYTERDMDELHALDDCRTSWIEEPLDVRNILQNGHRDKVFERLAQLQRTLVTPLCLDESFTCAEEAYRALEHPELRCFAIKVAKFGGLQAALDFALSARARGVTVWMGGMYDTGISKRLHAAFQTLPGIIIPGDIGATSRYFDVDITDPPYTVERGLATLNREGHANGIGCNLNRASLSNVLVKSIVIE